MLRYLSAIFVLLYMAVCCGCTDVDDWHPYGSEHAEVVGNYSAEVQVVSHRWKVIDRISTTQCEIGCEITLKVKKSRSNVSNITMNGIEYVLLDGDGFEVMRTKLNLTGYTKWIDVEDGRELGGVLLETGKTETYRGTATIPLKDAKRAKTGGCVVMLPYSY